MSDNNARWHWWTLRLTALPLIPLFFYFIASRDFWTTASRAEFISWVKQPVTALSIAAFVFCGFVHAALGVEEVIEDYVSSPCLKEMALCLNKLFFIVLGVASLYAVEEIYFRPGM